MQDYVKTSSVEKNKNIPIFEIKSYPMIPCSHDTMRNILKPTSEENYRELFWKDIHSLYLCFAKEIPNLPPDGIYSFTRAINARLSYYFNDFGVEWWYDDYSCNPAKINPTPINHVKIVPKTIKYHIIENKS